MWGGDWYEFYIVEKENHPTDSDLDVKQDPVQIVWSPDVCYYFDLRVLLEELLSILTNCIILFKSFREYSYKNSELILKNCFQNVKPKLGNVIIVLLLSR